MQLSGMAYSLLLYCNSLRLSLSLERPLVVTGKIAVVFFLYSPASSKGTKTLIYCRHEEHTWDNFICMLAKTCKNPTTASHSLLWAKLCWFPMHGPWSTQQRNISAHRQIIHILQLVWQCIVMCTCIYSVKELKTCLATASALEKFLCPASSIISLPE